MQNKLYGAILGDLAGQPYEFNYKGNYREFNILDDRSHFTDDTIMTLATAYAILKDISFEEAYKKFGRRYTGDFYGSGFRKWLAEPTGTVGKSWGNGCLMRLSPIIYATEGKKRFLKIIDSCICSHSDATSINAALEMHILYKITRSDISEKRPVFGYSPEKLKKFEKFEVRADKTMDFIFKARTHYKCSTAEIIKKVVKCGGDTDTNASIIGELFNYCKDDITEEQKQYVESKLDGFLLGVLQDFNKKFK